MLRFIPLPPGVPEFILIVVLVGLVVFVARRVARRREFAPVKADIELPTLTTQQRIHGKVRRVYRDAKQGVWLVEVSLRPGKTQAESQRRKFTFCATDYATKAETYNALVGNEADCALYGLATLEPGGAEVIRDQIKDADTVDLSSNPVRLIPGGQFANDYVVIGKVLSHRDESMDNFPLRLYRTQVIRANDLTMVLELGVPNEPGTETFPDESMVHGSARLYGYLA